MKKHSVDLLQGGCSWLFGDGLIHSLENHDFAFRAIEWQVRGQTKLCHRFL